MNIFPTVNEWGQYPNYKLHYSVWSIKVRAQAQGLSDSNLLTSEPLGPKP